MAEWEKIWTSVPAQWDMQISEIENITQKVWIRNNLNGAKLQVRFSNLYTTEDMVIDHATIGKWKEETEETEEICTITSGGSERILIPGGTELDSDEIALSVTAKDNLVVAMYFGTKQGIYSTCQTWNAHTWHSVFAEGDRTMEPDMAGQTADKMIEFFSQGMGEPCNITAGLGGVKVYTEESVKTIVCFGDSITHMAYYFDPLAEALYQKYPGKVTLLNCGVGGNRILYDPCYQEDMPGHGKICGEAAIRRFDRDVFGDGNPDIVFFLEGINDCLHGVMIEDRAQIPNAEQLMEAILSLSQKAHMHNTLFYMSTVMPFSNGIIGQFDEAERLRQELNDLIRRNRAAADGLVDLDLVMRKEGNPEYLRDGEHQGDGIHPNEAGGKVMAEAIMDAFFNTEIYSV